MIIFTRKSRTAWSEQLYQTIKPTGKRRTGNRAGDDLQWEAFKRHRPWRFTMSLHHLRFALVCRLYFSQHHHVILKELKLLKSQVDSEIWKEKERWNCLHSAELPSGSNRQQMDEFGGRETGQSLGETVKKDASSEPSCSLGNALYSLHSAPSSQPWAVPNMEREWRPPLCSHST